MQHVKGRIAKVLRNKPSVVTHAVLWSIPHNSGKEDIRLKLGRYKKPQKVLDDEELETLQPKSELAVSRFRARGQRGARDQFQNHALRAGLAL